MEHKQAAQRPDPERSESTKVPRWVKVSLIVLAAMAVLVTIALLSGHGPARHGSAEPAPAEAAAVTLPGQAAASWL